MIIHFQNVPHVIVTRSSVCFLNVLVSVNCLILPYFNSYVTLQEHADLETKYRKLFFSEKLSTENPSKIPAVQFVLFSKWPPSQFAKTIKLS